MPNKLLREYFFTGTVLSTVIQLLHPTPLTDKLAVALERIVFDTDVYTVKPTIFVTVQSSSNTLGGMSSDAVSTRFIQIMSIQTVASYVIEDSIQMNNVRPVVNRRKFNVFIVDGYKSFR